MPRIYANRSFSNASTLQNTPLPTCPFGELRTTMRTSVIDLKSTFGVSSIREYATVTTGATINGAATTGTGEYSLNTTVIAGSAAVLQSAQRGSYQSGFGAETGIGMRIPLPLPAGQVVKWGFYDGTNGFYWQYDTVNKLSCNLIRAGIVTQVVQANFNTDILDGTGPSTITFDPSRGVIYHILFSWYGYGSINFSIVLTDAASNQCVVPVHQFSFPGQTSVVTPHLPIRVESTNVSSTSASTVYLGGRQFCIIGDVTPPVRYTSIYQANVTYTTNIALRTIALRRKVGYAGTRLFVHGIDAMVTTQVLYVVYQAATVVGGTWTTPTNATASETALEANTTFTASTGGVVVFSMLFDTSVNMAGHESLGIQMTEYDNYVIEVTGLSGSGNQKMIGNLIRVQEEW